MDKHYLTPLFAPASVAIVGATDRPGSAGQVVLENILQSGFRGRVHLVNPNRQTVFGRPTIASLKDIDEPVDLAVLMTPARTLPEIVDIAGRRKVKSAIVVSSGFTDPSGKPLPLMNALLNNARLHNLRLLGPNSLGILRPDIGLHLADSRTTARAGNIALVSQSGALTNAILDWANANDVGFSSVVSLGDSADVKFGEVLDYLVWDNRTDGILLTFPVGDTGLTLGAHYGIQSFRGTDSRNPGGASNDDLFSYNDWRISAAYDLGKVSKMLGGAEFGEMYTDTSGANVCVRNALRDRLGGRHPLHRRVPEKHLG